MFISYLKIAWRNLLKNKFHTIINIGGLVIGFTIGLAILLAVYYQFSFDTFHQNKKSLYQAYQVYHKKNGDEIANNFGFPAAPAFKEEAEGIQSASRFMNGGTRVRYGSRELDMPVMLVDTDFFSMFSFPLVNGDNHPLTSPSDLVLTEQAAASIFGAEEPLGKTIQVLFGTQWQEMTVTTVAANTPDNSSLRFDALARVENRPDYAADKNNWNSQHHQVYIRLKEGFSSDAVEKQLRQVNHRHVADVYDALEREGAYKDGQGDVFATRLLALEDIHFSPRISGKGTNRMELYTVLIVGMLIILIPCFNFININLAAAFSRGREIGVRKCMGALKRKLFTQLWLESFLVCAFSFIVSLVLVNGLMELFRQNQQLNAGLYPVLKQPGFILLSLALLLLVSLIAGGYPAWVMARFNVVETLKGKISLGGKSRLRNTLIIVQFVIACVMIGCTFVIYRQFRHLQEADLGYHKEALISIPLSDQAKAREQIALLRSRLASRPEILSISGSNVNLGRGKDGGTTRSHVTFDYGARPISSNLSYVDYDYLKTLGIPLKEGRDFNKAFAADTADNVLLSESAAVQYGEKDLIGKNIQVDSGARPWHVIGIFPDFHLYSMHERTEPLTLLMNNGEGLRYCLIRIAPQNLLTGMEQVKKEFARLQPGVEFKGSFVDENISNWYKQEQIMALMFSIASLIAIILSCTGLLAMVLLVTRQRTKEIGVRKVLGASVRSIAFLLSKSFLSLVMVAILIAAPLSWMLMHQWLQGFAYRIGLDWWMFVLVGLSALLVAVLTISVNTMRVARRNPVKSLRTE